MLNPSQLKEDIKSSFSNIIPNALEICMRSTFTNLNDESEKLCSEFAKRFDEMVSDPLAERLADIIDQYVKSMCIYGTIITTGSPVTQTAPINPGGAINVANPVAGKVPNTFGIM